MIRARQLFTDRLRIIPGSAEMGRAELEDRDRFGVLLNATVPTDWPPPLNDENSMKYFTEYVETNPDSVGWAAWYFALKRPDGGFTAVGNGGFKGEPDASGTVEIGYSIMKKYQRKGLASEAVKALIVLAFSQEKVHRVVAQTFPDLTPSIRVLEKLGFTFVGDGEEKGSIMYELEQL